MTEENLPPQGEPVDVHAELTEAARTAEAVGRAAADAVNDLTDELWNLRQLIRQAPPARCFWSTARPSPRSRRSCGARRRRCGHC
jgi:hypothetical protein